MSLADAMAEIALAVSGALGGPFWDAEIITQPETDLDDGGSIIVAGDDPEARTCSAQVDSCTEAMRKAEGFTEKDRRVLVLAATLDGGITTDDNIAILAGPDKGEFMIRSVATDPCAIYFELHCGPA